MCQTVLSLLAVAVLQPPAPPPQFPTPPPPQFPTAKVKSGLAYPVRDDLLEKAKAIAKTDFSRFTADELKSLFAPMNNVGGFEPLVYITRLNALEYDKAVPAVTARTFRTGGFYGYHAGHNCPSCGREQTIIDGPIARDRTHNHTCTSCGTTWRH